MKNLPLGEYDFKKIREMDMLYVDKTQHIHQMVKTGTYYFLSRPRRFGKSLMVSTLFYLFSNEKELFQDLWIYDKMEWKDHPVVHISFNNIDYKQRSLEEALKIELKRQAKAYNINFQKNTAKEIFYDLILALGEQEKVVILIDEYDKPILDFLHDLEVADKNRDTLKNFFGVLKGSKAGPHLKMVFLTGVSKFSRVSIFSELNNLTDLTAHPKYTTMLGITQEELERDFSAHIEAFVKTNKTTKTKFLKKLKRWYDGYTWDAKNFVYNPHSLHNLFDTGEFDNFWFRSGTTRWLVKNLRTNRLNLEELEEKRVKKSFFDKFSLKNLDPLVLLYQTGYLTIKKIVKRGSKRYYIGYPNFEVRSSFLENLMEEYTHKSISNVGNTIILLEDALLENDLKSFITAFQVIFADISNRLLIQYIQNSTPLQLWEAYYHSVVYITLNLVATSSLIEAEVQTNIGFTDLVAQTPDYIYVMEFKIGTAQSAIDQIRQKKYYQKYQQSGKQIILVGIGFDANERNIKDWLVEVLQMKSS